MKARIVDIEDNKVTVKTENGKFITIPQKKFKFDCTLNQKIVIEKNEDKFYILPETVSFWDDDEPKSSKKSKNNTSKSKKEDKCPCKSFSNCTCCVYFSIYPDSYYFNQ